MTLSEMRNVLKFMEDEGLDIIHISDRITILADDYLRPSDITFFFNNWKAFFVTYPHSGYDVIKPFVYRMISEWIIDKYEARMNAKRELIDENY